MNTRKTSSVIETLVDPFQRFLKIEASGGILLLIFTAIALVWANSPLSDFYHHLWERELALKVGDFTLSNSIHHWINDGLMAIFFFFVGLEIKRELIAGELSSVKQASLPIAAAFGGMLLPALIFILVNRDPASANGWGIPMATDIAFSLGILSLLGKRVPLSLKVFLVALAIVDDLGAILVIVLFYSGDVAWNYLLIGMGFYLALWILNYLDIRYIPFYMIIGWVIWYMFYKSGIHPSIAGVLIAFAIPMNRKIAIGTFRKRMDSNLGAFSYEDCSNKMTLDKDQLVAIDNIEEEINKVQSPVQDLEHTLHHFVTFFIMPVFALANAGVELQGITLSGLFNGLSDSIEISLVLGKTLGIFLFTWLAVKIGIGILPPGIKWSHLAGIGLLGGMGFTMSLFISNLAFTDPAFLNPAKIGILIGSLIAGVLGYFVLKFTLGKPAGSGD